MSLVALGVDVGGSSIKFAPVQIGVGKLLGQVRSVPTPQPPHAEALLQAIAALASDLPADMALGVALPSVVRNGIVHTAANLHPSPCRSGRGSCPACASAPTSGNVERR